ncbi:hypothetical protein ACIA8E_05655 [Streptomyces sp. NPDC051664]
MSDLESGRGVSHRGFKSHTRFAVAETSVIGMAQLDTAVVDKKGERP